MIALKSDLSGILPRPHSFIFLSIFFLVVVLLSACYCLNTSFFPILKANKEDVSEVATKEVDLFHMSRAELEMLATRVLAFNSGGFASRDPGIKMKKKVLEEATKNALEKLEKLASKISRWSLESKEKTAQDFQNIVKMLEGMKSQKAAAILEQLKSASLTAIASSMKAKKLGEMLSTLSPADAAKITENLISLNAGIS